MAWVDIGERAALIEGSTTRGWAHFEYDNASGTTTRPCRIRIEARSGYSFNVQFQNITVGGTNYGTVTGVTQSSGTIWSANIAAGRNVTATWTNPWYAGSKSPSVSGYLPSGASAPTGWYINYGSSTWNSVTFTSGVASWGGANGSNHSAMFVGSTNGDADSYTDNTFGTRPRYEWYHDNTQDLAWTCTGTQANANGTLHNPIAIKGLTHYKLGIYVDNGVSTGYTIDQTLRYLPPAPGQFTYTDPGGVGSKTFAVTFTGDTSNNHTTYDSAELTRNIRYSLDNGTTWTSVVSAVTALDAVTSFNVTVPAGDIAIVEAYEVYHGMSSNVQSISLPNTNSPVGIYGSVNGESVAIRHLYGSVDGRTKKIVKLYASVGGVAKKVFVDE